MRLAIIDECMSDMCYHHEEGFLFLVVPAYVIGTSSERLCIIINNKTFEGGRFRHGSDKDATDLNKLFLEATLASLLTTTKINLPRKYKI